MTRPSWVAPLARAEGLQLDGVDDYVKLPDNVMRDLDAITVSLNVLVATDQATPYFIYGLGNTIQRRRQRLPVHHRQRVPDLDRDRQLDHRADRRQGREPHARDLEDAHLHARRRHGRPL